ADPGVPTSRTISTTAPLTGGGDLSANRTLAVSAASETASGVVELATAAETATGTDNVRAVHPAGAAATYAPLARALPAGGTNGQSLLKTSGTDYAAAWGGSPIVSKSTQPKAADYGLTTI